MQTAIVFMTGCALAWLILSVLALCFCRDPRLLNKHGDAVAWMTLPAAIVQIPAALLLCLFKVDMGRRP